MSIQYWPLPPESDHPQYLWNLHEQTIRLLFQNNVGLGIDEVGDVLTVSSMPEDSLNMLAHGFADFRTFPPGSRVTDYHGLVATRATFGTLATGGKTAKWVYARKDCAGFYESHARSRYSPLYHGWYHPEKFPVGDRAVVFIDSELPAGRRCIVMDSFNSMFEWDSRIEIPPGMRPIVDLAAADAGREIVYELTPGNYVFQLKGGLGGRGGNAAPFWGAAQTMGGVGGVAPDVEKRIIIPVTTTVFLYRGRDGANGGDGDWQGTVGSPPPGAGGHNEAIYASISNGGGGSSGEDSYIRFPDGRDLIVSLGGAGGGGAGIFPAVWPGSQYFEPRVTGGGGGGAGSGTAQDGDENAGGNGVRGRAGTSANGGEAGRSSPHFVGNSIVFMPPSMPGQNISAGRRRNGGDSVSCPSRWPNQHPDAAAGLGGSGALDTSDGYLRIFRTRDRTWQ